MLRNFNLHFLIEGVEVSVKNWLVKREVVSDELGIEREATSWARRCCQGVSYYFLFNYTVYIEKLVDTLAGIVCVRACKLASWRCFLLAFRHFLPLAGRSFNEISEFEFLALTTWITNQTFKELNFIVLVYVTNKSVNWLRKFFFIIELEFW